ncbi:ImuA family protein [Methylocystis sp. JAN1]|uniref:ImuA family protein n=1 Tax=Methylocystis sp. JAN1 TaxID=3397211 RepID=UPI003FA288F5
MSQSGLSERVDFLRARIAAIEARGGAANPPARAAGGDFLDALPGAGRGGLSEILPASPPDAPAASAFALAMALRVRAARGGGALVFIVEDLSAREFGLPYGRGLAGAGLDLSRFVLVRARRPQETLWAMEEALKSPACAAVVAESFIGPRLYDLSASRRLLLAARRGGGLGLLAPQGTEAARFSSAAELRVEVAAARPHAEERRPPLAPFAPFRWRLRLLKARAGLFGEIDPSQGRDIVFDPDKAAFRDAFPERFPAEAPDRPAVASLVRRSA